MEIASGQNLSEVFRTIIDYLPTGISLIDGNLNVVAWNEQFKVLLQFPDSLFVGEKLPMERFFRHNAMRGDYGPGDPEEQVRAGLEACGKMKAHVFERTRPDGTVLEVRGIPLPNGGFVTIYTDITQRKMAEIQIRAVLTNASIGILFTRDSKVMQCNNKFSETFGWDSPEELIGKSGSVFWTSPEAYREVGVSAGPLLSAGRVYSIECPMRRRDGSTFLGHLTAKAVNPESTSAGTIWIAEDVTEQRKVQHAIVERERLLSNIVDGTPEPTFVINADHVVTHWNHACENLTGVNAATMVGSRDAWRAFYDSPRPTMADLVVDGKSMQDLTHQYGERAGLSKLIDGAYEAEVFFPAFGAGGQWVELTAAPLRDVLGNVNGAIETLRDTTARRAAEQATLERSKALELALTELGQVVENLQQTQEELIRSEKLAALGSLVAGVSHELNTPIGNALLTASALQEETKRFAHLASERLTRSALHAYIDRADTGTALLIGNISRAAELIRSFKQLAADQTLDQRRLFSLDEVIKDVKASIGPKLNTLAYPLVVSQNTTGIVLDSYPGALSGILLNFINNALLHGFDGRETGVMTIQTRLLDPQNAEIRFTDDGVGMPESVCKRIFEPFFTTKLGQGGSGLGMHVAYNTVKSVLGGTIEVTSAPGEGTQCRLVLPLSAPVAPEPMGQLPPL